MCKWTCLCWFWVRDKDMWDNIYTHQWVVRLWGFFGRPQDGRQHALRWESSSVADWAPSHLAPSSSSTSQDPARSLTNVFIPSSTWSRHMPLVMQQLLAGLSHFCTSPFNSYHFERSKASQWSVRFIRPLFHDYYRNSQVSICSLTDCSIQQPNVR